jgi:hypothetical protein
VNLPSELPKRLRNEIDSFSGLWSGGYYEGDPLDPMGNSSYGPLGFVSILHATYLTCIKPYVRPDMNVLEIGPGRGAWTKCLLGARSVWCADVASAEENGFWEYVGPSPHVHYVQVDDFSLAEFPEDHFDFLFSFGVFCHISPDGVRAYFESLWSKLRPGAHAFVLIADYEKYNRAVAYYGRLGLDRAVRKQLGLSGRAALLGVALERRLAVLLSREDRVGAKAAARVLARPRPAPMPADRDQVPLPGRWYDLGMDRACALLQRIGYEVVERDIGVIARDPVIHFVRP